MMSDRRHRLGQIFAIAVATLLFVLVASVLISFPHASPDLTDLVYTQLSASGVSSPVTAVLLNFRGYDTMLEVAVLLTAGLGIWQRRLDPRGQPAVEDTAIERALIHFLVPVIVVVSAYVLWLGGHSAGGAFQAGAILSAAGILLFITGGRGYLFSNGLPLRLGLVLGPAVFAVVALVLLWTHRSLLHYPPDYAYPLIVLIESASMLSIALTLTLLFAGGRPGAGERH